MIGVINILDGILSMDQIDKQVLTSPVVPPHVYTLQTVY